MPLPWTEIRDRAIKFSREWQDAEREALRFELYQKYTRLLPAGAKSRRKTRSAKQN